MGKKEDPGAPANPVPSDAEIEAAATRLSRKWVDPAAQSRSAGASQILQSLTRGRSHIVTVEVKRSSRRPGGSR